MPSDIIRFYQDEVVHPRGFRYSEILAWDDDRLENEHDYIQWLFPTFEASKFNPSAPILTTKDVQQIWDFYLEHYVVCSWHKMMEFYGMGVEGKKLHWITPHNHNFLRITRMIKSLNAMEFPLYASVTKRIALAIAEIHSDVIDPITVRHWQEAR